jgi:hypothetical protein
MTHDAADIAALLPLPPATFHTLVALSAGDKHGYGIIQDVEARKDGTLRLSAGTLYRTIQRLREQGLIVEPRRPATAGVRGGAPIESSSAPGARAETRRPPSWSGWPEVQGPIFGTS